MNRDQLGRYVPAAYLDAAVEVMDAAETYAATNTHPAGFPVPARQLGAALELCRVGLLSQVQLSRFALAPSREVTL